jgi:type VI secretion system secreted protein VgrG
VEKIGGDRSYTVGGNFINVSNTVVSDVAGALSRSVGAVQLTASVASIQDNIGGALTENVGAVKAEIIKGTSSETVGGSKTVTSLAAELHLVKGSMNNEADGSVTQLVGGLHYEKVTGDYSVKAPIIAVIGAIGDLKGGGSNLKLGGGPVVLKGSKITIQTALLVHLGAGMKLGSG